ncbi:MAG TPA: hypothetical protein V6D22_08975 [Candidatus Obscuribacterales bacterium]
MARRKAFSTPLRALTVCGITLSTMIAVIQLPGICATEELPPIIVIDNDEQTEQQTGIQYQPLLTDAGATHVRVGARFPIVLASEISSKTARVGDPVLGRLKYDLKIGDRLVAAKGSLVQGHVDYALKARTPVRCTLSTHRWTMTSGCVGLMFDQIINEQSQHIPLVAEPARAPLTVKNKNEGRVFGVNEKGEIAAPYSMQVKYMAIRMGLNAAMTPAGVFSFGAMPVALGLIGAANPSFAFGKPIGRNVRHRRLKGFFWAALSGVPGSFLIEGTTVKGEEVIIKPGDEFLAEMQQDFTGEPATEAEMSVGAERKVHGQLMRPSKNNER